MARRILQIVLITAIVGILIFVAVIIYQIRHQNIEGVTSGTSDFPALSLLSRDIDTDTKSLIKANLQVYTAGKFNPQTAYILAENFTKTPQTDGTTNFQFNIVIPEAKSTYQISFTTSFLDNPTITINCAPITVQPAGSSGCYKPSEEDVSYINEGVIYA